MNSKKLSLRRESLVDLAGDDLRSVAAGWKVTFIGLPDVSDCSCVCSIGAACCNTFTCPGDTLDLLTGRACNL